MSDRRIGYDLDWQEKYREMVATPERAVAEISAGQRVFIGTGCAQPELLVKALVARANDLPDTEIVHLLTLGDAPYADKRLAPYFRVNSFFISHNVRTAIQEGLGDYTPIFLSDIPRLFASGQLPLDAALIQVTPPDERGMCSFGVAVDIVKSAAENARLVIAQVNPLMPRTLGDSTIHVQDLDLLVPGEHPIQEIAAPKPNEETRRIGQYIASLVDDRSTIEFGIGRIPQAVIEYLGDKKDLGIHTEMFTDALIGLIEKGVVTGKYKTRDRGKVVASFCMGTRRLYDYVDNNPIFSFNPTEYVNDPFVISSHPKMVAINVALEIDLTGQVCADSLGSRFYSGIGGQVDFNRGAARSVGGKAIIALPSTALEGKVSRIVCRLSPGAGVVTTRGDVHYVVTEHGVAYLHGKSVQERAIALISIAHPSFREALLREAIEAKYVRPEMAGVEGRMVVGPPELRTRLVLDDGTPVNFRSIHPTDLPRMRELLYTLTQDTVYYRFMSHIKHFSQKQILNFVFVDYRDELAIVGTMPEPYGEAIIAIGRYYLDPKTNRAEVAFVVHDKWQNRGIGGFLFKYLTAAARRNGISGFTAEVLQENRPMQAVLNDSECKVSSELHDGVYSYKIDFA
jgi:acyl-CoA hydrolase/GNAT superfamily N-acetyltransferase